MATVVFYDLATGAIIQCTVAPLAWIEADGRPWVEVPKYRMDWDATHRVEAGQVVPIS